jgi:hypothetical protein
VLRRFRRPHYESVVRRDLGMRWLAILLVLLAGTMAILFVIGRIDTARRSGTAAIAIPHIRDSSRPTRAMPRRRRATRSNTPTPSKA